MIHSLEQYLELLMVFGTFLTLTIGTIPLSLEQSLTHLSCGKGRPGIIIISKLPS